MSLATITFITMRPPGASRARMASQVSWSNVIVEAKSGAADVDGDGVVERMVVKNELAEIGDPAIEVVGQREKLLRDHEADRIVVDDGERLAEMRQPGGKVAAAASEHQDIGRARQQLVHQLDIGEDAFAVGGRLTLAHARLEIDAGPVLQGFHDLDLAVPALIASQQPHSSPPSIK